MCVIVTTIMLGSRASTTYARHPVDTTTRQLHVNVLRVVFTTRTREGTGCRSQPTLLVVARSVQVAVSGIRHRPPRSERKSAVVGPLTLPIPGERPRDVTTTPLLRRLILVPHHATVLGSLA